MSRRTVTKVVSIDTRSQQKVFTIKVPGNAKRVSRIIVTSKLGAADSLKVNRHYYGAAVTAAAYDNTWVHANLSETEMESTVKVFSIAGGASKHLFYARPSDLDGQPSFEVNGVSVSFELVAEGESIEDPDTGYLRNHDIYMSTDVFTTTVNLAVK